MWGDLRFRDLLFSCTMGQGLNSEIWGRKESSSLKKLRGKPKGEIIANTGSTVFPWGLLFPVLIHLCPYNKPYFA